MEKERFDANFSITQPAFLTGLSLNGSFAIPVQILVVSEENEQSQHERGAQHISVCAPLVTGSVYVRHFSYSSQFRIASAFEIGGNCKNIAVGLAGSLFQIAVLCKVGGECRHARQNSASAEFCISALCISGSIQAPTVVYDKENSDKKVLYGDECFPI